MQQPVIIQMEARKLVGVHISHSLSNRKTKALWSTFMPKRNRIENRVDENLFSIQIYESGLDMIDFTAQTVFTTWGAVAVTDFVDVPQDMATIVLKEGLYAVFVHKGTTDTFHKTAQYIYEVWMPSSIYALDDRAHFEILGRNYLGPMNPDSEEEVWIPIKYK